MGGGSIDKTQEHIWKWIHNATDWKNQNGIPMQADDCRLGPVPGEAKSVSIITLNPLNSKIKFSNWRV